MLVYDVYPKRAKGTLEFLTSPMKLTLRPEWDPRSLASFLGFIDIKTGVKMVVLFAILNKVAGVYGLIAVLTGAGGSLAQLSMYLYSVLGLAAFTWAFKGIGEEDPRKALITAHYFLADHILNTLWLVLFSIDWWIFNPHDGAHTAFSPAQQGIAEVGPGHGLVMTDKERLAAAQGIWQKEKGTSAAVLAIGWLLKFYFAALLYSYATHLQRGTYRSLPLTIAVSSNRAGDGYSPLEENELDEQYSNEVDGNYDSRRPGRSSRDIDFDADFEELDGPDDLERGRLRGRAAGSIGGYGEMVGAARPKPKGSAVPPPAQQQRVSYKPPPTTKTSPTKAPPNKQSRAIQQELERNGAVETWEDDDDDDGVNSNSSKGKIPNPGPLLSGDGRVAARSPSRRDGPNNEP